MPRRVNPALLFGLVAASVLLFALSASAAPEEGTAPGENAAPAGEGIAPENGIAPPGSNVLEEGVEPDDGVVPGEMSALEKGAAPEEDAESEEGAAQERRLPPEPSAAPVDEAQDTPVEVPEETFETFEGMLNEGEAEYGEYKNVDFEEGLLLPEITQTRSDLANAESGLEKAKNERDEKLKEVYTRGQDRFMRFLLEAKDFRQFANLLGFGVQALKDDQEKVQEWREKKAKVEEEKESLETQLQTLDEQNTRREEEEKQAQARMEEAQNFFESLPVPEQKEIEKEQASKSAAALDHTEKLLWEASQKKPVEEAENSGENAGSENAESENVGSMQPLQPEAKGSDDRTAEQEQGLQVEVAQAVADTIREWPTIKEQVKEESGENAKRPDEGAGEVAAQNPSQNPNPAVEQLAAAAKKRTEAQDGARQAAEQAVKERQAMDEAAEKARQADEAEKARQAAEKAPEQANPTEQEKLRAAAEDAKLQANFATEQAGKEKQAAEEIATQAADKLNAADKELADAQNAAGKVTPFALDPLNPSLDSTGKPISPGAGGGVLGEAKGWLGVPYDYSHSAGQTRKAVDCSAFTAAVYKKFGVALPDSPAGQMGMGAPVSGTPKAGDLVFWSEDGSGVPTHVGIANGDGTTTHSSSFTGEVSVTPMKYINGYLGARRLI
ncbi:MAG TPA: NlpC/P60 family protein [Rubrobacteraceae bacterium]|nr:NlpC/P60 family protein [Rubrobacteraceae bacterium]